MRYLVLPARLAIGALFIYASMYKVLDPGSFAQSIRNYQMLPAAATNLVAITLPWIELVAGAFLVLGYRVKSSALITTAMLAAFLVALFYAYSIGLDIDCGCFSSAESSSGRITPVTLARDSGLFLISLFILIADRGDFSLDQFLAPKPATSD